MCKGHGVLLPAAPSSVARTIGLVVLAVCARYDPVVPVAASPRVAALTALALVACAPEQRQAGTCTLTDMPEVLILRTLSFALADADGISDGFDLDGVTTTEGGETGCGVADYTSPDGAPGIDNAFSRLEPALNSTEAKISVIEGLVQSAIDSGELLLTVELGGVDDWQTDECVAGQVGQALGTPMLGTDGLLLDGQTFDRDEDIGVVGLSEGSISAGVFVAGGLGLDLPVQILNASLVFPLREGRLRLEAGEDGVYRGVLAGRVSAAYVLAVAKTQAVDPAVAELLGVVLTANGDFDDEDGTWCGAISVVLRFEAVGAYFYGD